MPKRVVTDEIRSEILRLRGEGLSYRQISDATGVSKQTANNICNPTVAERRRSASREYWQRPENRERQKEYRQTGAVMEKRRERAKNPRHKAYMKAYLAEYNHRPDVVDRRHERFKRYRQLPHVKERMRLDAHTRRARLQGVASERIPQEFRTAQLERQGGKCFYCQETITGRSEIEHVIPLSKGGDHIEANLVVSCPPCNQAKGAQYPYRGRML